MGTKAIEHPGRVPWELSDLTLDQFLEDVQTLEDLIKGLPFDCQAQMTALAKRYQGARPPPQDGRATMLTRHHAPATR